MKKIYYIIKLIVTAIVFVISCVLILGREKYV